MVQFKASKRGSRAVGASRVSPYGRTQRGKRRLMREQLGGRSDETAPAPRSAGMAARADAAQPPRSAPQPGVVTTAVAASPAGSRPARRATFFDHLLYNFFRRFIQAGSLTVLNVDRGGRVFGPGGEPAVTIRLHDPALSRRLVLNPLLSTGEAYMDGTLTIEEGSLDDFLHLCTYASEAFEGHPVQRIRHWLDSGLRHLRQHNPLHRARSNVSHHYDLSAELYRLFLDADLQYSCAYFVSGDETLEEAQLKKKRHIAAKLLLRPGMSVLDIGSGWGGMALQLARDAAVQVCGITLSEEQLKAANGRAGQEGLADRVRFFLRDYREETAMYDRILSVGMFEHVGVPHYREFFSKLKAMLKPGGVALLHAIGRSDPPGDTNPWIRKYIFPGGYCPALSEVLAAIERSGLWVTDIEILRLHYADTLREWARRFRTNRDQAKLLYDERFCRMWEYYLAACEAVFRNGTQIVFQIQLSLDKPTVPASRDYIAEAERASQFAAEKRAG